MFSDIAEDVAGPPLVHAVEYVDHDALQTEAHDVEKDWHRFPQSPSRPLPCGRIVPHQPVQVLPSVHANGDSVPLCSACSAHLLRNMPSRETEHLYVHFPISSDLDQFTTPHRRQGRSSQSLLGRSPETPRNHLPYGWQCLSGHFRFLQGVMMKVRFFRDTSSCQRVPRNDEEPICARRAHAVSVDAQHGYGSPIFFLGWFIRATVRSTLITFLRPP